MARPLRLLISDGVYHVTTQGNGGAPIFHEDADRLDFLHHLGRTVDRFGWRCLSYCLMTNHVHLLLRTPEPNLARGMQRLKTTYAQSLLRRHAGRGHVFGGRYGAVLVQRDSHLLEVFRYIALNPVRAGLCGHAADWPWSAHPALSGRVQPPGFLATVEAIGYFDGTDAYRAFIGAPMAERYGAGGPVFGTQEFKRSLLPATRPGPEIPLRDWGEGRPPLEQILDPRGTAPTIARAYRTHGYSMRAIADTLGCHAGTVSRRLKAYEAEMLDCKI